MDIASGSKRKRAAPLPHGDQSQRKRKRRAAEYHSSSEDEEVAASFRNGSTHQSDTSAKTTAGVARSKTEATHTDDSEPEATHDSEMSDSEEASSDDDSDDGSIAATKRSKPKRKDPTAFATSISKILSSKLTTTQRNDPVLSRSKAASAASTALAESRVEAKAKRKLKEDKKSQKENGRVKDVLGLETPDVSTGAIAEEEKQLRRLAQRGVIKLFNAVRAAQIKGEEAAREGQEEGMIGIGRRSEKVNEMSKKRFLDLLAEDKRS